ncbi:hypothetical protein GGR56DRAFT_692958 [Xylariaceae sp. FL0804]|nr:hypothetical protein GGR56DRAFT_692958 [Xylariaceae sp. FL0804]
MCWGDKRVQLCRVCKDRRVWYINFAEMCAHPMAGWDTCPNFRIRRDLGAGFITCDKCYQKLSSNTTSGAAAVDNKVPVDLRQFACRECKRREGWLIGWLSADGSPPRPSPNMRIIPDRDVEIPRHLDLRRDRGIRWTTCHICRTRAEALGLGHAIAPDIEDADATKVDVQRRVCSRCGRARRLLVGRAPPRGDPGAPRPILLDVTDIPPPVVPPHMVVLRRLPVEGDPTCDACRHENHPNYHHDNGHEDENPDGIVEAAFARERARHEPNHHHHQHDENEDNPDGKGIVEAAFARERARAEERARERMRGWRDWNERERGVQERERYREREREREREVAEAEQREREQEVAVAVAERGAAAVGAEGGVPEDLEALLADSPALSVWSEES